MNINENAKNWLKKEEETSHILLNCTLALSWTDLNVCKSLLESVSDIDIA